MDNLNVIRIMGMIWRECVKKIKRMCTHAAEKTRICAITGLKKKVFQYES